MAGVRAKADGYRVVYMSTGLEQITELAIRDTIAVRSLRWLSENVVVGVDEETNQPTQFVLDQNYPNPFNPTTKISFSISEKSFTTLKIYDILGNEVASLLYEEKPAGRYEIQFDASSLSSGVYLYKLQSNNLVQTRKMILLK
ncbi:MAG: T9SS type A sorting domain-containing protein [Ignavibacteriales bacterium]|nr:T9SS type A sorting domain-containing protein [Ignavibacteriales bacterium]